jgi:hypothetical protein
MKKILISIFAGVVIGAIVTALLFARFLPRPGPGETTVQKDKIVSGVISGSAIIKPKIDQECGQTILPSNHITGNQLIDSALNSAPNICSDFKTSVPVTGEIKTSHVDLIFSGVTEIERKDDQLMANTVFNPEVKETIYREPDKTWAVGLGVVTNFDDVKIGGHIQKDFLAWDGLVIYGRVEKDWDWQLKAGIEYRF